MNNNPDDAQLENELRAMRPAAVSSRLEERIFSQLARPEAPARPAWWQRLGFVRPSAALGWGLLSPAAAVAIAFVAAPTNARKPLPSPSPLHATVAGDPAPAIASTNKSTGAARAVNVPSGATDEGVIADDGDSLMRRVRYRSTDHVEWRNPRTGAQWEVSYPREDVLLVPVNVE